MAKKFYLVTSYHEEYGNDTIGLFDNQEQAKAAATLEEIEFKNDEYYDEWMDFYTTVKELEIDTKDYVSTLNDYRKREEEIKRSAIQKQMDGDLEYIKHLIEAYKEEYGVDPEI